jgi:hypothetical protein
MRFDDSSSTWTRRLGLAAFISIGLTSFSVALAGCNSPDATVGPGGGSGGQGGAGGAGHGEPTGSVGPGGAGGAGGAGGVGQGGGSGTGPKVQWATTVGSQSGTEYGEGLAIDAVSDIYLLGRYDSALKFLDGEILFPPQSGGGVDIFLAKYSPAGALTWSRGFGGPDDEYPVALGTDGMKLVVLGEYSGVADLGAGPLPDAGFAPNVFIAAFDPTGATKWSKGFGDSEQQDAVGLGLDAAGNVFATGTLEGSINFGGGGMSLTSAGSDDIFLVKLDGAGGHLWSKRFGDASSQSPTALGVDPSSGGVLITGNYDGKLNFGGGDLPPPVNSYMLYVASFAGDGSHKWSKTFQQDSTVEPTSIQAASDGSVYVGGNFGGTLGIGSDNLFSNDSNDIFIAKLDGAGSPLWAKSFGNDKIQGVSSMAVDADGGIVILGYFSGVLDFGGGPLTAASMCDPGDFCHDAYLVKLAPDGSHVYSRTFGGTNNDFGEDIAVDPKGGLVVSGNYSTEIDFGLGTPFKGEYDDIFLTKLK